MKTKYLPIILIVFILCSCTPSESAIQTPLAATLLSIPTQTAYPTYTAQPTLAPKVITTTPIPYTPTPAPTKTPTPTQNPFLKTDKSEGVWLVGTEVAIGNWRAVGGDCYEVTFDKYNDQMGMESGNGSIIYVPANAFTVKFVSYPGYCTWSYLGE